MSTQTGPTQASGDVRIIAFYLPQFHPIPENDRWWGEGFTEWTNVRRARPNFEGHYQPHVPAELGYYDLRDSDARERQATLAREHGVDGFCYYYYWFNGKRLLEQPLDAVLASGRPDFPFCVCWANENWTRRWDGLDHEILIGQSYSPEDSLAFIRALVPVFADRRYIRVDGRPLLIVYKPDVIPDLARTAAVWREECVRAGVGDPYLCVAWASWQGDPRVYGFDAAVEFPPHGTAAENLTPHTAIINPAFEGLVLSYRNYVAQLMMRPRPDFTLFRTVIPAWDNTARRQDRGTTFVGSSPEVFGYWLERVLAQTRLRHRGDERLVFVNAWNEWGEGCHLEPDARYGRQYLEAARDARAVGPERRPLRPAFAVVRRDTAALVADGALAIECFGGAPSAAPPSPRVSVVMPFYNHARYLGRALASLAGQTLRPAELVAVDDGSGDDSAAIVSAFARSAPFPVTLVRQRNAGADVAINRGLALARESTLALINSDDVYAPERLARLTAVLDADTLLAFSDTDLIDDADAPADGAYARRLRERIDAAATSPDLLSALVAHNVSTSTGNLVFRRALLDAIGGFAPMAMCHDWDFLLAATYATRIAFVRERLYRYRLHDANAFGGLALAGARESELVLDAFFSGLDRHPWLTGAARADFLARVRALGLGGYLARDG